MKTYTEYDLNGLKQLVAFKDHFSAEQRGYKTANILKKSSEHSNNESFFIQVFCQYNFANTDYSFILSERKSFPSFAEWLKNVKTDAILKCFTYIIWTNSFVPGYFQKKTEDTTIYQLLSRLDELVLHEESSVKIVLHESDLIEVVNI